ncbi:hypothetical protein ACHAXA_006274 [Cyclostephanos tholiformis]|uniref:Prenyltransferase alpha-alpha toroid domain-containing protein n=1 Tax=Cyclostephanos tholiformis TaxID=382380 RepID=A0ABD3SPF3_9STRA
MSEFERNRHIKYIANSLLRNLPKQYSNADTSRLTLVYFCVVSLDVLGCLPDHRHRRGGTDDGGRGGGRMTTTCCGLVEEEMLIPRDVIVEWIYGLAAFPSSGGGGICGFRGGTYLGPIVGTPPSSSSSSDDDDDDDDVVRPMTRRSDDGRHPYDHAHLAMTYVALCTLLTLGDDLSRVDKYGMMRTLRLLQRDDGSFSSVLSMSNGRLRRTSPSGRGTRRGRRRRDGDGDEDDDDDDDDSDLRFVYTAAAIRYILLHCRDDGSSSFKSEDDENATIDIDVDSAVSYVLSCRSYDGGLGLSPGGEGHGGSTFCGIASLRLLGVLDDVMDAECGWREELVRWCATRQRGGMQGRPNKPEDTCYSYWIGGTLNLLSMSHLLDGCALREYVLSCQTPYGGFGKVMGVMPDLLHSFYSIAWLSLSNVGGCCDCRHRADADDCKGYDEDGRREDILDRSIGRLSELDCALGMCMKRVRRPAIG